MSGIVAPAGAIDPSAAITRATRSSVNKALVEWRTESRVKNLLQTNKTFARKL
jgi:hypothetical protein